MVTLLGIGNPKKDVKNTGTILHLDLARTHTVYHKRAIKYITSKKLAKIGGGFLTENERYVSSLG